VENHHVVQLDQPDTHDAAAFPVSVTTGAHGPRVASGRAVRILLVEDDPLSAQVGRTILAHMGHSVGDARSGLEALSAAREVRFEAAVVDLGLPDTDGFAVIEELRRLQPELRCVLVTGRFAPDAERRASRLGVEFRAKPLDYGDIARWLVSSE
jgi:CheY-like chemotaxis protein